MKQSDNRHRLNVIISGGGTGGHIFPAIAIANALKNRVPEVNILFIGAKGKMEMEKVPAAGYPIEGLWISGLQRKLTLKNLAFPLKVISSIFKARKIIRRFKPDIVIGVGGFASGPTLRVASNMGILTLIQEQNSFPGITNKLLAKKVNKICVAYEGMEKYFPQEKIVLTGNPIRKEMIEIQGKKEAGLKLFNLSAEKPVVLVIGGSQGALSINKSIHAQLDQFVENGIQLIWQTGKYYFNSAENAVKDFQAMGIRAIAFIDRMDYAYSVANVIISRAGAIAISEICAVGKPAVFVPLPSAAEDHQTKNAQALVDKNAALMVKDHEANNLLVNSVIKLIQDKEKQIELSQNLVKLAKKDADEKIADEILALVNQKSIKDN
jgi:UDP-N-acetylglucosamine--N-acetylmuramyl-(pentapeptide) pyrophosphoryl-undecaprenol N-acetylglucosamine transferase